jgi:2-keto-4-pentenoate hydratase/2-oxohepta-3-ene-1,7-dioic acid hydratase in catechol pathway
MRLVTFEAQAPGGARWRTGALADGAVIDLAAARSAQGEADVPSEMIALLQGGARTLDAARDALEWALHEGVDTVGDARVRYTPGDVQLLPPLPRPNSVRAFSLSEEHLLNAIASIAAGSVPGEKVMALPSIPPEWYELPAHYKASCDEIYGPDATVPWPAYTNRLDFEFEIAAVIGKPGRGIAAEDAAEHIAGYTIYNDWSARDIQQREMRVNLGPGISKDFATGMGPCIATPDEFNRETAKLEVRVDGETWATSQLNMQFSFEEVIAWTSQEQTLLPGDVLSSGTVVRGAGVELNRWVEEGSVVELEAEGIGVLRNTVGSKGAHVELPPSQRRTETKVTR